MCQVVLALLPVDYFCMIMMLFLVYMCCFGGTRSRELSHGLYGGSGGSHGKLCLSEWVSQRRLVACCCVALKGLREAEDTEGRTVETDRRKGTTGLGAESPWRVGLGPEEVQGSRSQTWAEWGQLVMGWAGEQEVGDGHAPWRRCPALSPGWDSMGGSGCGVPSHWYWQVLKQQVSAPTARPPPSLPGMARAGTGRGESRPLPSLDSH